MQTKSRRLTWSVGLFATLLVMHMGYTTWAMRQAAHLQPSVIATVNIEQLFNGLAERAAEDARIVQLAEKLQGEDKARNDEIELTKQDLDLYREGSDEYTQTQQKIMELTIRRRSHLDYANARVDRERSRMLAGLYNQIKKVLDDLSDEFGYDIVFVDDSVVELPTNVPETEMMRQISARRMLYTNPAIDITEDVVARMNQRFAQAQP
jgi:Skp family chaperone for outer membrane proteins